MLWIALSMCRALTICKLHTVPPRPTSHQFVTDLLQGQGRLRQTRKMSKCMQPTPPADNSAAEVHRALQIAQANGLSWSEAQCRLLIDAVLAYRRGTVYWRWKASNVARRHGKAPLGAERHIRDAGEKAYMAPRRGLLSQGIDMRSSAPNKAGWNERC